MPEQMVRLRKPSGGNYLEWEGAWYSWPADDPVAEVPYALAVELLAIPDGGYRVEGDPEAGSPSAAAPGLAQSAADAGLGGSEEGAEPEDEDEPQAVTEPAPEGEHKVTEPAPPPAQRSPVTEKPRAATTRRSGAAGRGTSRATGTRGATRK